MRRSRPVAHKFVEFVPEELEPDTLYIAGNYSTASHLCLCGCGKEVVTPLAPAQWQLLFDGETVSLKPSIGNWDYECRSHYWIKRGRVVWARSWSEEEVRAGRAADAAARRAYFDGRDHGGAEREDGLGFPNVLSRVMRWLASLVR